MACSKKGIRDEHALNWRGIVMFMVTFALMIGVALGWMARAGLLQIPALVVRKETAKNESRSKRRVFVVENQTLVGAGIQHLLAKERDLTIEGITPQDEDELFEEIHNFRPTDVVLDRATTDVTRLCFLLSAFHELRIVFVSANDNRVQIYSKRESLITQISDLLHIIRSN